VDVARAAAPEIDRLVLAFNRRVGPQHGARLSEVAREIGLATIELLPQFGDFLAGGRLTRDIATLRLRYWPAEHVLGRLDELEAGGYIAPGPSGLAATDVLQPLLDAIVAARAAVGAELWGDHDDDVAVVTSYARNLADAATEEHVVAVAHRSLPEPTDPYLALEHRLVTLRYIRQHDHAAAWLSRDLTAQEMVVLTSLWSGGTVDAKELVELECASGHRWRPVELVLLEFVAGHVRYDVFRGDAKTGEVANRHEKYGVGFLHVQDYREIVRGLDAFDLVSSTVYDSLCAADIVQSRSPVAAGCWVDNGLVGEPNVTRGELLAVIKVHVLMKSEGVLHGIVRDLNRLGQIRNRFQHVVHLD
jgi:hypothetical protein